MINQPVANLVEMPVERRIEKNARQPQNCDNGDSGTQTSVFHSITAHSYLQETITEAREAI
jgi:hypothetical protein